MAIKNSWASGEVLTAADLTDTFKGVFVNAQTGSSYTLGTADSFVSISNASGGTVTIPTNATAAFNTGAVVGIMNAGTAGTYTISTAAGVTLNSTTGGTTLLPLETVYVIKLGTNTWQTKRDPGIANAGGLVYITGNTFSGSSAVNVNNCFTSTYRHYRLGLWLTAVSADLNIFMRLRAAGSDNTSTSYRSQRIYQVSTTIAGEQDGFSSGDTKFAFLGTLESTEPTAHMAMADIMSPEATAWTTFMLLANVYAPDLNSYNVVNGGAFRATTSFDGFSLITSTGTISGSLVVYGYRNS